MHFLSIQLRSGQPGNLGYGRKRKYLDFPDFRADFFPKSTLVADYLAKKSDILVHASCTNNQMRSFDDLLSLSLHHSYNCGSRLEKLRNSRFEAVFWHKTATLMTESRDERYGSHLWTCTEQNQPFFEFLPSLFGVWWLRKQSDAKNERNSSRHAPFCSYQVRSAEILRYWHVHHSNREVLRPKRDKKEAYLGQEISSCVIFDHSLPPTKVLAFGYCSRHHSSHFLNGFIRITNRFR